MAKFHCLGVDTKAVRFTEAMVRDKKGFGVFKQFQEKNFDVEAKMT